MVVQGVFGDLLASSISLNRGIPSVTIFAETPALRNAAYVHAHTSVTETFKGCTQKGMGMACVPLTVECVVHKEAVGEHERLEVLLNGEVVDHFGAILLHLDVGDGIPPDVRS